MRPRILIVEDVPNVAAVLKARLESFDYVVCDVAHNGPEAVACALQHQPDLVIMDILLEGDMNGIEAAQQINRQFTVPIIFLSCLNDPQILDQINHVNTYGYILKPYDQAELRFNIENALARHRTDQERSKRMAELEATCRKSKD